MKDTIFGIAFVLISFANPGVAIAQGMSLNATGAGAHSSAIFDASSTTQGILLPRMSAAQRNAISSPATGLMLFQTDSTTGFYYYTGSAWNAVGVGGSSLPSGSDGQVLQMAGGSPTWVGHTLSVGDTFGGGIVGYILQSGDPGYSPFEQHGLIVDTGNTYDTATFGSYGRPWGPGDRYYARGFTLGTGRNNTTMASVNLLAPAFPDTSFTIRTQSVLNICKYYSGGGYTDWYLPSKDELNMLYINRSLIGGFSSYWYWSSTQLLPGPGTTYKVCAQYFGVGPSSLSQNTFDAYLNLCARAVRSF